MPPGPMRVTSAAGAALELHTTLMATADNKICFTGFSYWQIFLRGFVLKVSHRRTSPMFFQFRSAPRNNFRIQSFADIYRHPCSGTSRVAQIPVVVRLECPMNPRVEKDSSLPLGMTTNERFVISNPSIKTSG